MNIALLRSSSLNKHSSLLKVMTACGVGEPSFVLILLPQDNPRSPQWDSAGGRAVISNFEHLREKNLL